MTRANTPQRPLAERVEDFEDLVRGGVNPLLAAQEVGWRYKTATKNLARAGRRDLYLALVTAHASKPWLDASTQDREDKLVEHLIEAA